MTEEELRARVEARRAAGEYPVGLEEDMDAHWQRVRGGRSAQRLDDLRRTVADVPPGGLTLPHGNVADRVVQRTVVPLVHQLNDTLRSIRVALDHVVSAVENDEVMGHIHALWDTLAAHERMPGDAPTALRELARRVEALEEAERGRRFDPPFPVAGEAPAAAGRSAFVVDDRAAVDRLGALDDESLDTVTARHVVECLGPQRVVDLVLAAYEKLRPGGTLVVESADPSSGEVWLDPRVVRPIHPVWLASTARQVGFAAVDVTAGPQYRLVATR